MWKHKRYYCKKLFGKKIDYYNCNYDEVISLGYNCEVSQRLADVFIDGKFEHYLYTWSYETDRKDFLKSLKNLNGFEKAKYSVLPFGMIEHKNFHINFHSRYSKQELLNDDNSYTDKVPLAITELKDRLKYLSEKTENIFKTDKNLLFIIKLIKSDIKQDFKFIQDLDNIIKSKLVNKRAKYTLLVVIEKKFYSRKELKDIKNMQTDNIKYETVRRFAHDAFTDCDGDIFGWYRILRKFLKKIRCHK